jgi:hypothetical protein
LKTSLPLLPHQQVRPLGRSSETRDYDQNARHTRLANKQFGLDGIEIREACVHPVNVKFDKYHLLKMNSAPVTSTVGKFGRFFQPREV